MWSNNLDKILSLAVSMAMELSHELITAEHLLFVLLADEKVLNFAKFIGINLGPSRAKLFSYLSTELSCITSQKGSNPGNIRFAIDVERIVERTLLQIGIGAQYTPPHSIILLYEILQDKDSFASFFLRSTNITNQKLIKYICSTNPEIVSYQASMKNKSIVPTQPITRTIPPRFHIGDEKDARGSQESTSALDQFCINLNAKAEANDIDEIVSRSKEIERMVVVLSCRRKNNVVLVGEPGVGKTALVEQLAIEIVKNKVDVRLKQCTIYALDIGSIVAGTRYRGDFEERIKNLLAEIEAKENIILFIDEIHSIIGAGSTNGSSLDISNLLKPLLSKGKIRCIGATSCREYHGIFAKDAALLRRFIKINVEEPTLAEATKMLMHVAKEYSKFHSIKYTEDALRHAVILSDRFVGSRFLPDKALDIVDEAGSFARLLLAKGKKVSSIGRRLMEKIVSQSSLIPCSGRMEINYENVKNKLKKSVKGQGISIDLIVNYLIASKFNLMHEDRPMGIFLLYGPTGTGKTFLAHTLAKELKMHTIRVDMSEFIDSHSSSKLLGSPPGFVGHERGTVGFLDEVVNKPYSVVIFDEIEKSHQNIHNLLLQIMDYGFVTDSYGRKVNFRHSIIIFTSNVGADIFGKNSMGFKSEHSNDNYKEHELRKKLDERFSPEFLNRIDLMLPFSSIPNDEAQQIISTILNEIGKKLAKRKINFVYTNDVIQHLQNVANVSEFGARNIKRTINTEIGCKIAEFANKSKIESFALAKKSFKDGKIARYKSINLRCSIENKSIKILTDEN